jgi:ectoine hydroxylase-related dioxygenase (phytanoyl-CoA dioxygenase family)
MDFEIEKVRAINFQGFDDYLDIYNKYGVVIFRNFFEFDPIYTNYYNDIKKLAFLIAQKHSLTIDFDEPLNKILTEISKTNREEVSFIYDLGTRPMKLNSGILLKSHPAIMNVMKLIMGEDSIIGHPFQGETLHIFPPGKENFKHNLPMHQDYPYIMQSPEQITAYINLGNIQNDKNGGIRVWLGSHKEGLTGSTETPSKTRITSNSQHFLDTYDSADISFDNGDFAIFHSLLQHEGIQNHTDCTRIVQLVRYSNLSDKTSISYGWRSCEGAPKKGIQFSEVHPNY